jgi:hypothetical protein
MRTKAAIVPIRTVKFGLAAPLLFVLSFWQTGAIAQVVDEEHVKFVQQLALRGWDLNDTVITFSPDTYEEKVQIVTRNVAPKVDGSGKLVYQYAEIQPQYPGGKEAMDKFLRANLKYPEMAWRNNQFGTVVVHFVVDKRGKLLEPKGRYQDESMVPFVDEAVRVIASMPKWIPAKHQGKTVRCAINLPVKFTQTTPAAKH